MCEKLCVYPDTARRSCAYGAHVDDSTAYQVYNKTVPQDNVKEAVAETASEILTCQGEPVEAYYFSTSVGFTNTPDAWNVTDPGQYPYLQRVCLNIEPSDSDLSKEQTFRGLSHAGSTWL